MRPRRTATLDAQGVGQRVPYLKADGWDCRMARLMFEFVAGPRSSRRSARRRWEIKDDFKTVAAIVGDSSVQAKRAATTWATLFGIDVPSHRTWMPDGDLLARSIAGSRETICCSYQPKMCKFRVLLRSNDRGRHWNFAPVAGLKVGKRSLTVMVRLSGEGGTLICLCDWRS